MFRQAVAILVALYAAAFAFAALAAFRLPAIAALNGMIAGTDLPNAFAGVDWRRLSIVLGGPYLLASLSYFLSAGLVSAKKPGAARAFLLGSLLGFPCLLLVDFHAEWWRAPNGLEVAATAAALMTVFILSMIVDLSPLAKRKREKTAKAQKARQPAAPRLPSPAVLRQRQMFIEQGRRAQARSARSIRWTW